ncbi:hypothetical protein RNZ50_07025 [Paracoccaceae bacterium Fryx2]|nr:hypothetical protein [Paracoccaceae bacterium Fryx2]
MNAQIQANYEALHLAGSDQVELMNSGYRNIKRWPCGSTVEARGRGSLRIVAKVRAEAIHGKGRQATENAKDSAFLRDCSGFVRHDS